MLTSSVVKLAINLGLSFLMLAVCAWLAWPNAEARHKLSEAIAIMDFGTFWPYLVGYVVFLMATHFFRAWRWNNLLAPIGAPLPPGRLLAISSVGFMAILALPARLGEFVRPALLRRKGVVSASAVLGTVAVERIVDGLMVSLMVFACCFALRGPAAPSWMMPMAYASLGIFLAAMTFLAFALKWPRQAVHVAVLLTGARKLVPRLADKLEEKLYKLISGFLVLKDGRNLAMFVFWSALYWACNGLGMWVLAQGSHLELSVIGAFATMGIVAVGITLPNSPGLVGQFQAFTVMGLSLYMPEPVARGAGLLYAVLLHGIQLVWYLGVGAISLHVTHLSWSSLVAKAPPDDDGEPGVVSSA
ncbi:MAG: flippase-like domain-containing protein [Deltaproteobacteria bacterium]|nr:flippase-like domain-containing protein [Deltaproteobacteria bacterium]